MVIPLHLQMEENFLVKPILELQETDLHPDVRRKSDLFDGIVRREREEANVVRGEKHLEMMIRGGMPAERMMTGGGKIRGPERICLESIAEKTVMVEVGCVWWVKPSDLDVEDDSVCNINEITLVD